MNVYLEELGTIPLYDGKIVARLDKTPSNPTAELEMIICKNGNAFAPCRYQNFSLKQDAAMHFLCLQTLLDGLKVDNATAVLAALGFDTAPRYVERRRML